MSGNTDRRVLYTKMFLRESLVRFLSVKPISRITVKELCEDANVNRGTFYTHYSDQYDLLTKTEGEIIDDINQYLDSLSENGGSVSLAEGITAIFGYISQNAGICRVLLGEHGDMNFQNMIMEIVRRRYVLSPDRGEERATAEYQYTFITIGVIGLIQKWLDNDMDKTPAEMADIVLKLAEGGLRAFMRQGRQ